MSNILVVNPGSKTTKFKLFRSGDISEQISGIIDDINGKLILNINAKGFTPIDVSNKNISSIIKEYLWNYKIDKIGFRVVHGGGIFTQPTPLNKKNIEILESFSDLAPLHNPIAIKTIKSFLDTFDKIGMYAVFDTSFHSSIPIENHLYAIPYEYYEKYKIRKYGFHGISHKFISEKFFELEGMNAIAKKEFKLISCHLGSGSSVSAILNGKSFDTSMGFTPLEGLIMTTRSGDLDNGVIYYMHEKLKLSLKEIQRIENKESGLLGISGISFDMRTLLKLKSTNKKAALAVKMYTNRVQEYIGRFAAQMGGADGLIFTGGIGAGSDYIRDQIVRNMGFLGFEIDDSMNEGKINVANDLKISTQKSKPIWIIPTNEELQIAKEIKNL